MVGLFTGKIQTLWDGKPASAIAKSARTGRCQITELGLDGDAQADPSVHGGPDQAIHHYDADHMAFWQSRYPDYATRFAPGCFGENIATTGMDEHTLCIGDVLSLGSARVQISQGREPCWKLDAHLGLPDLAYRFRKTQRTGWYYRVLAPGTVTPDAFMHVIERPAPDWTVHAVTAARFDPHLPTERAQRLADLAPLSRRWRHDFARRANGG
ncbi:MOSC domain-containing protein [Sulfitobacter sp. S190]|nr:MOSC domain-containing protein [Sulfitobacter sp. S190]